MTLHKNVRYIGKEYVTYFVSGSLILIDFQIRCHSFKDFLLRIELGIWSSFEPFNKHGIPNVGASWRCQNFDLFFGGCTHHHGFAHYATHFGWLQVAKENGPAILHFFFRDEIDQPGDDRPGLVFSNINWKTNN